MNAMFRLIQATSVAAVVVAFALASHHAPPDAPGRPSEKVLKATWGADKKKKTVMWLSCSSYNAGILGQADPKNNWVASCKGHEGSLCVVCEADEGAQPPSHMVTTSTKEDQDIGLNPPGNAACGISKRGTCMMVNDVLTCKITSPLTEQCADVVVYPSQPIQP